MGSRQLSAEIGLHLPRPSSLSAKNDPHANVDGWPIQPVHSQCTASQAKAVTSFPVCRGPFQERWAQDFIGAVARCECGDWRFSHQMICMIDKMSCWLLNVHHCFCCKKLYGICIPLSTLCLCQKTGSPSTAVDRPEKQTYPRCSSMPQRQWRAAPCDRTCPTEDGTHPHSSGRPHSGCSEAAPPPDAAGSLLSPESVPDPPQDPACMLTNHLSPL